jgi:hypothetical protein
MKNTMFLASWLGNITIIEVHCDSEYEDMHGDATIDLFLEQFEEASDSCALGEDRDPCALEGQLDGQDDSTCASTVISHSVDDLTLQQSGETSGDLLSHSL